MVVLAVHVRGDRPAEGDVAGPRHHREGMSARQQFRGDPSERGSRGHGGLAPFGVQAHGAGESGAVQDGPAGVLRGVAVGAPQAAGQRTPGAGRGQRAGDLAGVARAHHTGCGGCGAAPSAQEHGHG